MSRCIREDGFDGTGGIDDAVEAPCRRLRNH